MHATTVKTRLAIDPPRMNRLLSVLAWTRGVRLMDVGWIRRSVDRRRLRRAAGGVQFALRVEVTHGNQSDYMTLVGAAQADAAAAGASATVRAMLDGEVSLPGVWMPEQVLEPVKFFRRLGGRRLVVDRLVAEETKSPDLT
jgi:hypothetical protein